MAKDGTNRGGARPGAGRKKKSAEKENLRNTAVFGLEKVPEPAEYLSANQKNGVPLGADEIYKETWLWLKNRGCEKMVNPRLVESYSQAFARYIQCENAISAYGLLGKHPTTGGVISSPFVSMSQSFQKQANLLWYEIYQIVRSNSIDPTSVFPQNTAMERLLQERSN